jgi:hypothetical protein
MRFSILKEDERIVTFKQFDDFEDCGEIAHFLAELDVARLELLELWKNVE